MYVNQLMAAGIETDLAVADLELVRDFSVARSVAPVVEVTSITLDRNETSLLQHGFVHDRAAEVTCLAMPVDGPVVVLDQVGDHVDIRPVTSTADPRLWQATSALGWQHGTSDARRASDAFAAAAYASDDEHMVVALDSTDGRPLGCASMTVRDGVAVLGGMSTLPSERRRGVQAALLQHRLARAHRLGCDLAITTALAGGASERNLRRHGFQPVTTIRRFERRAPWT